MWSYKTAAEKSLFKWLLLFFFISTFNLWVKEEDFFISPLKSIVSLLDYNIINLPIAAAAKQAATSGSEKWSRC